ncbi:MAG: ATP-dependent endonuclease [Actinomycetota bacterium]
MVSRRYETGPDATIRATDEALTRAVDARAVILVEGTSDQIVLESLATRLDRDLDADGVVVAPIGGAHAIRNIIDHFAHRTDLRLSGLVDRAEADVFVAAAAATPLLDPSRIHVCHDDLEDELIRAMDPDELETLLDAEGDLGAFRTMQHQPAWREQPVGDQMHRWMRSISGRTNTYGDLIVRHAETSRLPKPLVATIEGA